MLRDGKQQVFVIYSTISFVDNFEHTVENTVYSLKKISEKADKLAVVDSLNRVINIKSCIKIIQKVIEPFTAVGRENRFRDLRISRSFICEEKRRIKIKDYKFPVYGNSI